jgi:hypothetical protein
MSEYERTIIIQAPLQTVEDFISRVDNLPKYVPETRNVTPEPGERVRVQGKGHGHEYDTESYFKVDKGSHYMEWGSDSEEKYRGWIRLQNIDQPPSTQVTVHLSFEPTPAIDKNLTGQTGNQGTTIDQEFESALISIKNMIEGHGSRVEPSG